MKIAILLISLTLSLPAASQTSYGQNIQKEQLDRGVVALRDAAGHAYVSWRTLPTDTAGQPFDIYRNGERLNTSPLTTGGTFYIDEHPLGTDATYEVRGGGHNGQWHLSASAPVGYIPIPLDRPEGGTAPDGRRYDYIASDASIGDVDGDGQYEVILKWDPRNARDNSHAGYTGHVFFDCYRLSGERLWRIDLGQNIRAGAHYTQFLVYDFDGDGRAELMLKTADGTIDGEGTPIGDATRDWRCHDADRRQGRILDGPEYLSVFDGRSGKALCTTDYVPSRGDVEAWGDGYGNRCDRFLATVAYLDGRRPSAVFCRGYYTRTVLAAWDWDGQQLHQRWVFDTDDPKWASYAGQGNHNLRTADFDGDGCDEIAYGSMAVDHDGTGLYNTGFGHGDAMHIVVEPATQCLLIWDCHENKRDGVDLRDGRTGTVVFQNPSPIDVGRCMAADIDPTNEGMELWSIADRQIYNTRGEVVRDRVEGRMSCNFGIWWDADTLRELLDHETVLKYDWQANRLEPLFRFEGCRFNNGSKSNPCLQADILGDWREEVVVRDVDSSQLRIYVSPIPTPHRVVCLEDDIPYRLSVAAENVAYNQPPELGATLSIR